MSSLVRRNVRAIITLLLLGSGVLLSSTIDSGRPRDAEAVHRPGAFEPRLTATVNRNELILQGTTASAQHEAGLLQVAADQFGNRDLSTEFAAGIGVPDTWEPVSLRLLYALATMESATAIMNQHEIVVRGMTFDAEQSSARLAFLREAMPAGTSVVEDVVAVDGKPDLDDLCRRMFGRLQKVRIEFRQSSAVLRPSSFSSLDKLVDFAHDCQHLRIAITGHSDASGDEHWNRRLGLARAQAVADYLTEAGIAAQRLLVESRGSSMPIADNDTAHGRSLNRRIEFELRSPLF